jgi:hypothetical protein
VSRTPSVGPDNSILSDLVEDMFEAQCLVCGERGRFARDRRVIRESFRCPSCGCPLRYPCQAREILDRYARHGSRSIAEVVKEPEFRCITVFEPGHQGPFRRYLRSLDGYTRSFYDDSADPGEIRGEARNEDLMDLSMEPESFDLVITSEIFEHVRHPYRGFSEVFRVLRRGGRHVFTIPVSWPMRDVTVPQVDVTGDADVFLRPPKYHGAALVYNEFGRDLLDVLDDIGFVTSPKLFATTCAATSRMVTFCSVRPFP